MRDVQSGAAQPETEEREEQDGDAEPYAPADGSRPAPNTDCPPTFGNSDIWGGRYTPAP